MGQQPHPAIRVILAAFGALAGASLAASGDHVFAILMGALAGLALFEVVYIRDRLTKLERELADLREPAPQPHPTPAAVPDTVTPRREAPADVPRDLPVRTSAPQPPAAAASTNEVRYTDLPSWSPPRSLGTSHPPRENPIVALVREYFTGGNALVRAGVVVLFFGVAFLLRYLAEHTHIPIELRLSGVAFGALVLLGLGW